MKPVIKLVALILLLIIGSGIFFVLLDDDDTKNSPLHKLETQIDKK